MIRSRAVAAFTAAACALGGAGTIAVAVAAGPTPGLTGYVSEAGITTSGYATPYRVGVFGLAAALLLLAVALPSSARLAAALLGTAAAGTLVSGAVTCTDGCPLPPFEAATTADLVHGGASVAAVAASVFAMLAMACSPALDAPVRRLALAGLTGCLPLSGAVGLAMLLLGRGTVVGLLERILLGLVVLWVAATGVRVGVGRLRACGRPQPATGHSG